MLQSILEDAGFATTGVRHPERVLDEAARCKPGLFLIDIMLEGRSGIDIASALRSNGFGGTPMIAISASHIMTRAATHSGLFQAVLEKPLDLDLLLDRVTQTIG
jgi:CheY-like chemotaxis protein